MSNNLDTLAERLQVVYDEVDSVISDVKDSAENRVFLEKYWFMDDQALNKKVKYVEAFNRLNK